MLVKSAFGVSVAELLPSLFPQAEVIATKTGRIRMFVNRIMSRLDKFCVIMFSTGCFAVNVKKNTFSYMTTESVHGEPQIRSIVV
ncbi:hypothetical protein EBZ80_18600 [bacterium]|nr:hypothetical protein [bacterium]